MCFVSLNHTSYARIRFAIFHPCHTSGRFITNTPDEVQMKYTCIVYAFEQSVLVFVSACVVCRCVCSRNLRFAFLCDFPRAQKLSYILASTSGPTCDTKHDAYWRRDMLKPLDCICNSIVLCTICTRFPLAPFSPCSRHALSHVDYTSTTSARIIRAFVRALRNQNEA